MIVGFKLSSEEEHAKNIVDTGSRFNIKMDSLITMEANQSSV